jgi:hypothetical protein
MYNFRRASPSEILEHALDTLLEVERTEMHTRNRAFGR